MANRPEKSTIITSPPRRTRKQVALRFEVSVDQVTRWWEEGRLRGVDLNAGKKKKRELRFSDEDIEKFQEELYRRGVIERLRDPSN